MDQNDLQIRVVENGLLTTEKPQCRGNAYNESAPNEF